MSPKTGRPIAGESKKDKQIGFRVSPETLEKFDACAKLSGKPKIQLFQEMVDSLYERLTKK